MALRLVRQTSDTPNITNKDDAVMTRYAYGGYNGVVKGFGNECGYTTELGVFKVLDGRIVIDGWEIDGAGWTLDLHSVTGTQYHSVYAEINIATESVKLDSTYLLEKYPTTDKGDDLTEIPNGTARLLLYNVKVVDGIIEEVVDRLEKIPYTSEFVRKIVIFENNTGIDIGANVTQDNTNDLSSLVNVFSYTESLVGKTLEIVLKNLYGNASVYQVEFGQDFTGDEFTKLVQFSSLTSGEGTSFIGVETLALVAVDNNTLKAKGFVRKLSISFSSGFDGDISVSKTEKIEKATYYITKVSIVQKG